MKTYSVILPITGVAYLEIEAETEAEALEKAFDNVTLKDVEEWEAHKRIVSGNVLHASQNEYEVTEMGA